MPDCASLLQALPWSAQPALAQQHCFRRMLLDSLMQQVDRAQIGRNHHFVGEGMEWAEPSPVPDFVFETGSGGKRPRNSNARLEQWAELAQFGYFPSCRLLERHG